MVTTDLQRTEEENGQIIKTSNWEQPVVSLDGWISGSASLSQNLFDGPMVRPGHGIDLNKDIIAMATGSRGSVFFYLF